MRYRLRTLLIVLALGPLLVAVAWFALAEAMDWLSYLVISPDWN
jgi:hypothetical protein